MRRTLFLALLCFAIAVSATEAPDCAKLAARHDGPENNYRPPLEASVIGKGRLPFHTAPSIRCKMKGVFVVPGNVLTVYKSHDGWASVMYVGKSGDTYTGWVKEHRIHVIGQYGQNP